MQSDKSIPASQQHHSFPFVVSSNNPSKISANNQQSFIWSAAPAIVTISTHPTSSTTLTLLAGWLGCSTPLSDTEIVASKMLFRVLRCTRRALCSPGQKYLFTSRWSGYIVGNFSIQLSRSSERTSEDDIGGSSALRLSIVVWHRNDTTTRTSSGQQCVCEFWKRRRGGWWWKWRVKIWGTCHKSKLQRRQQTENENAGEIVKESTVNSTQEAKYLYCYSCQGCRGRMWVSEYVCTAAASRYSSDAPEGNWATCLIE